MTNDTRVTTKTVTSTELAQKAWGKEWSKPEVVYVFSGGRAFQNPAVPGIYQGTST